MTGDAETDEMIVIVQTDQIDQIDQIDRKEVAGIGMKPHHHRFDRAEDEMSLRPRKSTLKVSTT